MKRSVNIFYRENESVTIMTFQNVLFLLFFCPILSRIFDNLAEFSSTGRSFEYSSLMLVFLMVITKFYIVLYISKRGCGLFLIEEDKTILKLCIRVQVICISRIISFHRLHWSIEKYQYICIYIYIYDIEKEYFSIYKRK